MHYKARSERPTTSVSEEQRVVGARRLSFPRAVLTYACLTAVAGSFGVTKASAQPSANKKEEVKAARVILEEPESGNILLEKNADQPAAPGAFACLMAQEVVFDALAQGRINLDDQFEVTENAWRKGGAPSHTSSMFAPIHSRVRVEDLLRGAIVQSGNDACIALAEGVAGNEAEFTAMMNKRAPEIGLKQSIFANASGRADGAKSLASARDLAKLAWHIIRTHPNFYELYGEREFTWNKIRQQNRNPLLGFEIGADGLRAGYSGESGYSLVASAVQNGMRLILVIEGASSEKERTEIAKKLFEWGFHDFELRPMFGAGESVGEARTFGGRKSHVGLVGAGSIGLMVPRGAKEKITARIVYTGPVPAPIRQGQPIGILRVWRDDMLALEIPLQAGEDIDGGSLLQRAMDGVRELAIGLFKSAAQRL
jgi:D-alanyl-D-alanine carboxypeptidase (penicillin-binding protein 5/6)